MNKTDKNYKSKQKLLLDFKHFLIKYRQQREWPYKRGTTILKIKTDKSYLYKIFTLVNKV